MAGDVVERSKPGKSSGLRRPKRRLAIRIDMTPMVDIAFLLLIFYMVSTVFAQPQAMEINLPDPDEEKKDVEVKASNLLTVWVDSTNELYWKVGIPSPDSLPVIYPPKQGTPDSLGYVLDSDAFVRFLADLNRENTKLSTLVLINRGAKFASMVEILDNIDLLERTWNADIALKLEKKVKALTKDDGKFSYRYAMGKWEERDTKIIDAARAKAHGLPVTLE